MYVGSMGPGVQWDHGPGVQWDPVTENQVVLVHRKMCKYTIISSSPGPTEHRVPLNPHIPLIRPPALPVVLKLQHDPHCRDAQPALVIGRHYMTERDSAPVQYNGIV